MLEAQRDAHANAGVDVDEAIMAARSWVKPTGFMKYGAGAADAAAGPGARARLARGLRGLPDDKVQHAGRALHGLRHPVLPHGLPARQPHPRVERPRLPRPLARRRSTGCTRPTTSPSSPAGSARRRARPRACSASTSRPVTIKQIEVEIIDRAWDEGWVDAASPADARPASGRGRRLGPGGPRRRAAAHPRRPRRHRLRARRPHRRAAALRHPRVQDGEAPPRPPHRADGEPRARSSAPTPTSATNVPVDELRASSTRSCSPAARPRGATCPFPGASSRASTRRWSTCRRSNRVQQGDLDRAADHRAGQARRHHRRRRHRRRLPRHRASARVRRRSTSSRSCPGRPTRAPTRTRGRRSR